MRTNTRIALAVAACSIAPSSIVAAEEIDGKVAAVEGKSITVDSSSEFLPAVGDKFGVFVEIPGVGKASVGSGTIIRVEDNAIVGQIEKATGRVSSSQLVVINSPKPQKRPAAKAPILLGRSGKDAKKVIEDAGFVAKIEVGVDAPDGVKPFTVYKQKPSPNEKLAANGTVTIMLYGGDPITTTPSENAPTGRPGSSGRNSLNVGDEVIVLRTRHLIGTSGAKSAVVGAGMVRPVQAIKGTRIRITNGQSGWIDRSDVIPFDDSAIERLSGMLADNSDDVELFIARGRVYRNLKQYEQSIADLDQAIRLHPDRGSYYHERGFAHYDNGDYEKAISDYTRALAMLPNTVSWNNRGMVWREMGEYNKAIADFRESLALDPKNTFALTGRGLTQLKKGEYELAIADFDKARMLGPQLMSACSGKAFLLATCPDSDFRNGALAVTEATRGCELSGWTNAWALAVLAAAYAETGDFELASLWQTKSLAICHPRQQAKFQHRLELFRKGLKYRQEVSARPHNSNKVSP